MPTLQNAEEIAFWFVTLEETPADMEISKWPPPPIPLRRGIGGGGTKVFLCGFVS